MQNPFVETTVAKPLQTPPAAKPVGCLSLTPEISDCAGEGLCEACTAKNALSLNAMTSKVNEVKAK